MPRVIQCEGCQQSHLIRDDLVGRRVRCDCGRVHPIPPNAPSVPAPTGLLDAPVVRVGSAGLLLVSVLVLGGVVAWVVGLDAGFGSSKPTPLVTATTRPTPVTTKKQKPPPTTKKQKDPDRDNPQLLALLEQLKDPDLETNEKAVKGMVELDDATARRAIPAVIAAAGRQDNENFRKLAEQELKGRGAPLKEDYDCLKVALRIPHPGLQRYVVSVALKDLGDKARDALGVVVEAMKHRDPEVRREAFTILKNLGPNARVPAVRLLLNPSGDADEEASLGVLKTLLGESDPLTAEEIDALAEALRDAKRGTKVRCFAVENLGKGERAARAIPALLDVLREKGDAKLLTLSIKALSRIGDKRKDVLTSLLTLAASAGQEEIRLESLHVAEQLDPSAVSAAWILERWKAENGGGVKQELAKMLQSRLVLLKPEQMTELLPLLRHKDADIVLVGLNIIQARKEEAAEVAGEVADLLKHDVAKVREAALAALQALGPAAGKAKINLARLLDHWRMEKDDAVRQALANLLQSRLGSLKREQMKELLPLLQHKDKEIVLVGLKVVQDRKEEAADVVVEVADLLKHDAAKVRETALNALQALGSSVDKALPNMSSLLLDRWGVEKDAAVRQALLDFLQSRLALLKREQMKELLPLLGHKDTPVVLVGLKSVQAHKKEAAEVAAEVADLLKHDVAKVREAALAALKALGTGAAKALPKLFEILEGKPPYQRAPLAVTIAGMVDVSDSTNVDRLVPFLLEGLHPKALQDGGDASETAIHRALVKIGQPAVEGCFTILSATLKLDIAGADNVNHRKKLYEVLAKLGPTCRSQANYQLLLKLRNKEVKKKYKDVIAAAGAALSAMDPD